MSLVLVGLDSGQLYLLLDTVCQTYNFSISLNE